MKKQSIEELEKKVAKLEKKLLEEKTTNIKLQNKLQNVIGDTSNVDSAESKTEIEQLRLELTEKEQVIEKLKKQIFFQEKYFLMPDFVATIVNAIINAVDGVDDINGAFKYIFAPYWNKERLKPSKEEIEEFLQMVKNDATN